MRRLKQWIERLRRLRGLSDIGAVVVLSLATLATAWCSYQSARWSGIQDFRLNAADQRRRDASRLEVQAAQLHTLNGALFVQFISARKRGETELAEYLRQRFPPAGRMALEAWLDTDPLTNPDAPKHPFVMPEYQLPASTKAEAMRQAGEVQWRDARQANANSDNYVLLSVLFAAVLFFAGICTKLPTPRTRRATLGIGVALFLLGVGMLAFFPIAPP